VVCVEIATDHNAFDCWRFCPDYVTDVRQELSNSDLTFSNVLCGLGLRIAVDDSIALKVQRINTNVLGPNLKPREREAPRW
jgi:hypothetical protein